MFPLNRLAEKISVNRFSINRRETDKMEAKLALCKSRFMSIIDVTDLTFTRCQFHQHVTNDVGDRHITIYLLSFINLWRSGTPVYRAPEFQKVNNCLIIGDRHGRQRQRTSDIGEVLQLHSPLRSLPLLSPLPFLPPPVSHSLPSLPLLFKSARGSGEHCRLPQRVLADCRARPPTHFWCI